MESMRALLLSHDPIRLEPLRAYQLEGTGLVRGCSDGWQIRCALYRQYFQQMLWAEPNWVDD